MAAAQLLLAAEDDVLVLQVGGEAVVMKLSSEGSGLVWFRRVSQL